MESEAPTGRTPPRRLQVPTLVPGLDYLLAGGLPTGTSLLIAGEEPVADG